MADAHSAVGDQMDCFASPFGHTTLRCSGLDEWESRLLIFPVTLFLVGALAALANWIRLALNQQSFKRRHFVLLVFYGFLVFSLGVADKMKPAGEKPWHSSRIIGGISILPDIILVAVVYHFLPPHVALPWWLDRALAATSCSGLILMLLGGIRNYSPDGLDDYDRDSVYAAAACELVFLVGSLFASQCARYFAIMGEHGRYRTFVNLDSTSNSLFVISLLCVAAQTCLSFVQPPDFTRILAASMLGAVSYLLLIGVSIVQHLNSTDEPNERRNFPPIRVISLPEKVAEGPGFEALDLPNPDPRPSGESHNDVNSDFRLAQRYLQETENEANNASNVRQAAQDHRIPLPGEDPGAGDGTVVWHGKFENRLRVHSGMSASSWGRLEMIMRSRKQQQQLTRPGGAGSRPLSGMTYYGSETSFPDIVSHGTRRTSLTSSKAGWRSTFMSQHIPPVPAIAPRFLRRAPSPSRGAFAVPLTAGETPIPLDVDAPKATGDLSPPQHSKTVISSLTGLLWRRKENDAPYDSEKANPRRETMKDFAMASLPSLLTRSKMSASSDVKASTSTRTLHGSLQVGESILKPSLPPQYQSSKLFPVPLGPAQEPVAVNRPVADRPSHHGGVLPPWQDNTVTSKSRWSGESDEDSSAQMHADRKYGPEDSRHEPRPENVRSGSIPAPEEARQASSSQSGPTFDIQQQAFTSSFRNARIGSPRTIAEETEPTNDSIIRVVSGQSRNSDLSITHGSDETSPRSGKLRKETQGRVLTATPGSVTPDGFGGMIRRQRSEPDLFINRLTGASTETGDSTISIEIDDIDNDAAYDGYRTSSQVGTFSSTRSGATVVQRQAPAETPKRKSSKRAASSARVAAERKGWTRTDADEDDARTIRDVSSSS